VIIVESLKQMSNMNEIYWISRLDAILTVMGIICTLSVVALIGLGIMAWIDSQDEVFMSNKVRKKLFGRFSLVLIIVIPILIFVPSSKEAMVIWGVGKTIDYVQDHETFKELPNKCVKALEAWAESLNEDK
jgi:hypothetical protein